MSKSVFASGGLTFDSVTYAVTNLNIDNAVKIIDVTDSGTIGSAKEFWPDREDYDFTVDIWKDINVSNIAIGSLKTGQISFNGFLYVGTIIFSNISDLAQIGDAIKQSLTGKFSGTVTETAVT